MIVFSYVLIHSLINLKEFYVGGSKGKSVHKVLRCEECMHTLYQVNFKA